MDLKKALFISQEIAPYLPASAISTPCGEVSQSLQQSRVEVRTFTPKYGCINERRNQLHEVIRLSGLNIVIDDTDHPLIIKVATLLPSRMQVYFIDNDDYFGNRASQGLETVSDPDNNGDRTIFFARGVVETVRKLRWYPEVIVCSGWLTALNPMYVKTKYADDPAFKQAKVVMSLFADPANSAFEPRFKEKLMLDGVPAEIVEKLPDTVTHADLVKIGIDYADAIVEAEAGVDPELLEYARATGKPMLSFAQVQENYPKAYAQFFSSL